MVKTWTYKELDEKYGKLCKRYNSVCYDKQRLQAQLKEEKEAYNRKFLDYCEVFGIDPKKYIQEYYHDIVLNSDEYKKLEAENQRLKAQLDREIHINRKMKRALEQIASENNCYLTIADEVLKEIEEME